MAVPTRSADAVALPPPRDALFLTVAVCAVSAAGPLIAATAAPALAIAFWRNGLAGALVLPAAALFDRSGLRSLDRRSSVLAVLAGLCLAAHFGTWIPSLTLTSVASSTTLVTTQPVWVALIARARGQRVGGAVWAGTGVALLGAVAVTGVDWSTSADALVGDLLALIGGIAGAVYTVLGATVRARVSTTTYTGICYPACALALLAACLIGGVPLTGYEPGAWARILVLTVCAQFLGHSLVNAALRSTGPAFTSLVLLLEVPGAALVAAVWLGQVPPALALPGLIGLLAGLAIVVRHGARSGPPEPP